MPISSFYGMQTSLRGLIAQQRMLDTTGHNIANASTKGYSRQEALLSASSAMQIQTASSSATGSHLGSGVDVDGFRRVRDQFLDAQYRGQNTNLSEWTARAESLDSAELSLAEPGDTGINEQLTKFWKSWSDLSKNPDNDAAKQAVVQQANALTDSIHSVRSQMVAAQASATGQYDAIAGPDGEVSKIATELAGLNKTISSFITNGDMPNDLMDRRDLLIDQLSGYGQVSVEQLESGSTNVSFVDGTTGTSYPIVTDRTAAWAGPPAGGWSPGGEMGGLLSAGKSPGGTIDGYLATIDSISNSLVTSVNAAYGGDFFSAGTPAGSTIAVAAPIQAAPASIRSGTGASGSSDLALAISQLRRQPRHRRRLQGVRVEGRRRPQRVRRACRPTPRCSPTPSRTAARAWPASRWTRRCPTSCASSAPTRPLRVRCRRWTRCSTS